MHSRMRGPAVHNEPPRFTLIPNLPTFTGSQQTTQDQERLLTLESLGNFSRVDPCMDALA